MQSRLRRTLMRVVPAAALAASFLAVPSSAGAVCVNEALRTGASAGLPDCRAYELVSPPDSDGRQLEPLISLHFFDTFPTELATGSGDGLAFVASNSPLAEPGEATGSIDAYEALRSPSGWRTTRKISPSGEQGVLPDIGGLSADHRYAFVNVAPVGGVLGGGTLAGTAGTDYVSKPDGSFEETGFGSLGDEPMAQGRFIGEAGKHVIFSTGNGQEQDLWCVISVCLARQLEAQAPPTGTGAIYDRELGGPTHVVSLLPGDNTPATGESAEYQGASADGSAVAFKIGGTLYVRVGDSKTEAVTSEQAAFAGLSTDGGKLFFVRGEAGMGGDIEAFDTGDETVAQINTTGDARVVNVSADGSRVYFISPSQLDGAKGTAGEPNLYVWTASSGTTEYIATVLPSDLESTSGPLPGRPALTNWTGWVVNPQQGLNMGPGPGADPSRTTANGSELVFESRAKLTTYENAGHTEIYRYDARTQSLICVSANPSDAAATSDAQLEGSLAPPLVVNNLSEDGNRVFFETAEGLVDRDTDGINDIYEWEEAPGASAPTLSLISSGKSTAYPAPPGHEESFLPKPNLILAITPSGDDVFFTASEQLVPEAGAGGTQAIYDARVGGGFAEAPVLPGCVEEACRPAPTPAPRLIAPKSEGDLGRGNVRAPGHQRRRHSKRHRRHRHAGRKRAQRGHRSATVSGESDAPAPADPAGASPGVLPVVGREASSGKRATAALLSSTASSEFGIETASATLSTLSGGGHPDFMARFVLNHHIFGGEAVSAARSESFIVSLPPGLVGNPTAIPKCSQGLFAAFGNCPVDTQVGVTRPLLYGNTIGGEGLFPVFNLEPPHPETEIARFGFFPAVSPVYISVKVRTASDYGVTATVDDAPGQQPVIAATTTFWGDPSDPSHDEERLTTAEGAGGCVKVCEVPGGKRSSGLPPTAFMTNPSACQQGEVGFGATSYQLPGRESQARVALPAITDCGDLPFSPSLEIEPTSHVAGAPTGLVAKLHIPQHEGTGERATSTMRGAKVTLPRGMTLAAGAADGLAACTDSQVHLHQEVAAECPDASQLGTVTFTSPDLAVPLHGEIYQRAPEGEDLFRIWLVSDQLGLHIKLPGEVRPDASTGQLTTEFADLPQLPVNEVELAFWGGQRAPLANPNACGAYLTGYELTPWSGGTPVAGQSEFKIGEGCDTGAFAPRLSAGVTDPRAGSYSPFVFTLRQEAGEQNLEGLSVALPDGLLARLAGVGLCADADLSSGRCPSSSQVGTTTVATGPGPLPLWIPQPGKAPTAVYLAGPYRGAPYSLLVKVPAQAGPFDLGEVLTRVALEVDPESTQVTAVSDPLPQFIKGVAVRYRVVQVDIDRAGFTRNPTSCEPLQISGTASSAQGASASIGDRFQVGECKQLKFKPSLRVDLKGSTKRSGHPALTAELTFPKRGRFADIRRAQVNLPHSEFLDQGNLDKTCTRPVLLAANCPKRSLYGRAKAWTPLLDGPLEGPVYLVGGYGYELPALVAELNGQIRVLLVGKVDVGPNKGIRTTFEAVPDAPVSRFVLRMFGGPRRSLLENSEDLCRKKQQADVRFVAHNGRVEQSHPAIANACRGKRHGKKKHVAQRKP